MLPERQARFKTQCLDQMTNPRASTFHFSRRIAVYITPRFILEQYEHIDLIRPLDQARL